MPDKTTWHEPFGAPLAFCQSAMRNPTPDETIQGIANGSKLRPVAAGASKSSIKKDPPAAGGELSGKMSAGPRQKSFTIHAQRLDISMAHSRHTRRAGICHALTPHTRCLRGRPDSKRQDGAFPGDRPSDLGPELLRRIEASACDLGNVGLH